MKLDYYTLQVYLKEPLQDKKTMHFQFKNLDAEKIKQYREEMFLIGIRLEHTARSWEVVSPFNIKSVMIIGQESKF